jgi:hypothetical protein
VERDIWLLEQLESNSNRRRRNLLLPKDELPFPITQEILQLPGYKPRVRSSSKLSGKKKSFSDFLFLCVTEELIIKLTEKKCFKNDFNSETGSARF